MLARLLPLTIMHHPPLTPPPKIPRPTFKKPPIRMMAVVVRMPTVIPPSITLTPAEIRHWLRRQLLLLPATTPQLLIVAILVVVIELMYQEQLIEYVCDVS